MIYTKGWCPYCSAAKDLLRRKGAAFEEIDVERVAGARAEMIQKAGGRSTVPQIFIGQRHVGGCDDLYALDGRANSRPCCRPNGEPPHDRPRFVAACAQMRSGRDPRGTETTPSRWCARPPPPARIMSRPPR